MTVSEYITNIKKRYNSGISREHAYRGDLQQLLESLLDDVLVINEPKRIACGSPDYVLTRKEIPIGYIEAKDIGDPLKKTLKSEQLQRYTASLDNLILTDYINFIFLKDGEIYKEFHLFDLTTDLFSDDSPELAKRKAEEFSALMKDFVSHVTQTIRRPLKLATMMANKAKLLSQVIFNALTSDVESDANSSLRQQMDAFKQILIHDTNPASFSDIYAQTIAYGMFAARLHDETLDDFSRHEAATLIPQSNPFLRKLFQYISGYEIDDRIEWIVAALADIFRFTDVKSLLDGFGQSTQMEDPFIHFYETFLAEYNPALRKARGVWYTPEPVVSFIVRAVDDILKSDFGIAKGLADNSKVKIKSKVMTKATTDGRSKMKETEVDREVHRVQFLDPATGTGTFLAHFVKYIYSTYFASMQGGWSTYVENDLIPRMHGFEILMASYAMAHLKLEMLLKETGYDSSRDQRLGIYLTNSLEPGIAEVPDLFMANWLTDESLQANDVKQNMPVMIIAGNPPYSGESKNKGKWIMDLMEDYKKEPGGREKLKERNPKWINDDYVKFIRYGQHFIEKNGSGILAFINPHGFLDNPTFRGMRWNLLKTYDTIYTIDLHGNSKKKETSPDGSADINVFDIQQGVSLNFFIKTGENKNNELGQVFHYDLYGKRKFKYNFLTKNSLKSIVFKKLENNAPMYFMVQKDLKLQKIYSQYIDIDSLFISNVTGFQTHRDDFATCESKKDLIKRLQDFVYLDEDQVLNKYKLKETKEWAIKTQSEKFDLNNLELNIYNCAYRPFDERHVTVDKSVNDRPRTEILKHYSYGKNPTLLVPKQQALVGFNHVFISQYLASDCTVSSKSREGIQMFPLYTYLAHNGQNVIGAPDDKQANFNKQIISEISEILKLTFTIDKELTIGTFSAIDLLDYIYAILHSPNYRETYKEFLKISFPRVPYPEDQDSFWRLVSLGGEIRQIHLLETPAVEQYITQYPADGDNVITRKITKNSPGFIAEGDNSQLGRVWINDDQYFDNVPLIAWEFYIGGYQPAQKWLKDRRGRNLEFDDILHYQKIIVALTETDRLMGEIDKILEL